MKITNRQIIRFHELLDLMTLEQLKSAIFNINHRITMKKLKKASHKEKS